METKTQKIVNEVQVPVKETGWKKFWQRMDGNRTMILSVAATVISLCPVPEPAKGIILTVLGGLGATTFVSHVKNGGFKRSIKGIIIE